MREGREGDWECSGCNNRNYAFRSFCNRCKQPRLLVDNETPADSKWLPRIGDWICTGCTNNNYASREKCKKCGQSKEVAAMPAIAMTGASFPTYSHNFSRAPGGPDQKMNIGLIGNSASPVSLWLPSGSYGSGLPYDNSANPNLTVPKGWRNGDWICNCGFHNYSSRSQCKKCNAFPPALGTKRLASEELVYDWDNKRLNVGHTKEQQQTYSSVEQVIGASVDSKSGVFPSATINSNTAPSLPMPVLFPPQITTPALLGKGAKQWRNGDWMCTNCNNHNYASRLQCNSCFLNMEKHLCCHRCLENTEIENIGTFLCRCKTQRMAPIQPVNVM